MTAQINEKVRTDSSRLHMINEIIARIIIIHGPLQHSFQCRSFHDNEGTVLLVQFSRRGQALLNILMSIPLHQYNLSPPYFFNLCAHFSRRPISGPTRTSSLSDLSDKDEVRVGPEIGRREKSVVAGQEHGVQLGAGTMKDPRGQNQSRGRTCWFFFAGGKSRMSKAN